MADLTPLQYYAHQLRENFERAQQERKNELEKRQAEGKALINKFACCFSTLYSLLIGSDIDVQADVSTADPVILLTNGKNQIAIVLDKSADKIASWNLYKKTYKATVPNESFGIAANREDEHRLIIAIEDHLFNAKPKAEEHMHHRLQTDNAVC